MEKTSKVSIFLKRTIYFKILWGVLVLLRINPFIRGKGDFLGYFLMIYGAAIIIYDFFTDKKMFKNVYILLILLFIGFMGLSTFINYNNGLVENVKIFIFTVIQLMVIGRVDLSRTRNDVTKEIKIVNLVIIIGVTVASLVSLYLVFKRINGSYELIPGGVVYNYGMTSQNRLVGIFTNPNSVGNYCAFALLCIITNLSLSYNKLIYRIGYYASIIINFSCVLLSNSRGALLGLYMSILVFIFLGLYRVFEKFKRPILRFSTSILISLICVAVLSAIVPMIDSFIREVPNFISEGKESIELGGNRKEITIGSDLDKSTNARIRIWKMGFNTAKMNPIFGVGKAQLNDIVQENWKDDKTMFQLGDGGLHNIFLETLVAYGIFTLFILLLIIGLICISFLIKIMGAPIQDKQFYTLGVCILSLLVYSLTRNLLEASMIYKIHFSTFIFILYLGYSMYFIQKETAKTSDNIVYRHLTKFTNYINK